MEGEPVVDTPKPTKQHEGKKKERRRKPKNDQPQYKVKEETAPKGEEPPQPSKYRVKQADAKTEDKPEGKPADGEKKQRKRKPKGEKAVEKQAEDGEKTEGKKEEKKKPEEPKNTVYKSPMDFVETKKFKDKYDEFRNGEWRRGSGKTYVTLETEIPAMPEKILEKPDEDAFRKKLSEMSSKIKDIGSGIEEKSAQFKDTLTKLKGDGPTEGDEPAFSFDALNQKFKQAKVLSEKKKKQQEKVDAVLLQITKVKNEMGFFNDNIDRFYNKAELVPKGLKQAEKDLYQNGDEKNYQRRVKFLKDSIEYIEKRSVLEDKLKELNATKKIVSEGLPELKKELQKSSKEIQQLKDQQSTVKESKDNYSKELDKLKEKKQKDFDAQTKLRKAKNEMHEQFYADMILYQKQQHLIQDIKWMTDMKEKLVARKAERDRIEQERRERKEKYEREKEERKRQHEERKKKEEERRQKEIENKKQMEEEMKQTEINELEEIQKSISDTAVGSNPLFDHIDQCEQLKTFCQKQLQKAKMTPEEKAANDEEEKKEEKAKPNSAQLDADVKKGKIELAPSKQEREVSQYQSLKGKKGRKTKKAQADVSPSSVLADFSIIKKFASLKITAPLNEDDLERAIMDLGELREALVYWGKIIQRQSKIKFIKKSRKLSNIEEFQKQAEEEETYILNEKKKFDEEDADKATDLNLDKLKIAQLIDKEDRLQKAWHNAEDEVDEEQEEEQQPKKEKVRQSQRPKGQKFKEIVMAESNFPTLENEAGDEDEDDEDGDAEN